MTDVSNIEDIGLKIGTKEESFWSSIKKNYEKNLENCHNEIKFLEVVLQAIEKEIQKEKI